jgi:predicted small lipoprotein YifL
MKNKIMISIVMITTLFILLTGCGTKDNEYTSPGGNPSGNEDTESENSGNEDAGNEDTDNTSSEVTFDAQVMEAGDSLLVAPDPESNEYKSSDKMLVNLLNAGIKNSTGDDIAKEELKVGDTVKITYNGVIAESYPAQISASLIQVTGHNNVIDGYMAIIDDIYQMDPGLNSEIDMMTFDTTGWVELTQIEKEIIFSLLKEKYGVEIVDATFDELAEQGLIDKEQLYFPNGIHIVISNMKFNDEKNTITYSISKWRSGLGAVGSDQVTAEFDGMVWNITKDGMWIS